MTKKIVLQPLTFILLTTLLAALLRFIGLRHLPPGLWFDEAWISTAARDGANEVYFAASFGGMHPAIVYLTRLGRALTQSNPLAIRYTIAAVTSLTVPLSYLTLHEIGRLQRAAEKLQATDNKSQPPFAFPILPAACLLYPLILTLTYPFHHFSRLGFESILPAPAALLCFYLLARALRHNYPVILHPSSFIILGLALGLTLYAFDTARFIPLAVALAYWLLFLPRTPAAQRPRLLVVFGMIVLAAVIAAAPLLIYFLQNWDQFTTRAAVTTANTLGAGAGSIPRAILSNLGRTLAAISLPGFGDHSARHNLPGRPIYDPALSLFFWLGLGQLIRHHRTPAAIILLSWLPLTLLPVILTDGAPTYTRIFGAIPALAAITAVGTATTYQLLHRSVQKLSVANHHKARIFSPLPTLILACALLFSLATLLQDYFIRWPHTPALYDEFQVGDWEAAHFALAQSQTDIVYLVPDLINRDHPTFDLLLRGTAVRSHPPTPCLIYPTLPNQTVTYLIDERADKTAKDEIRAAFPTAVTLPPIRHQPTGDTIYQPLQISPHTAPTFTPIPTNAAFATQIRLTGYTLTSTPAGAPAPSLQITLHWQATAPPTADYTLFLHLYPAGAENTPPIAQLDTQPCWPTSRWHTAENIRDSHTFPLPPALPPGNYTLALGLYTFPTFQRLPLTSASPLSDNRHLLATLTLGR